MVDLSVTAGSDLSYSMTLRIKQRRGKTEGLVGIKQAMSVHRKRARLRKHCPDQAEFKSLHGV